MKMTVEMPAVNGCSIKECAYNINARCHAKAITVGHSSIPGCDTFLENSGSMHVDDKLIAGVGACKVSDCVHNVELECGADEISVGMSGDQVINCLTYATH